MEESLPAIFGVIIYQWEESLWKFWKEKKAESIVHCVPLLARIEGFSPQHMWRFARRFFFLDLLYIIDAWGSQMHYCNVLIFLYLQISCKQIAVFPDLFSNLSCLQSEKWKWVSSRSHRRAGTDLTTLQPTLTSLPLLMDLTEHLLWGILQTTTPSPSVTQLRRKIGSES